jgi:hypothetical protein
MYRQIAQWWCKKTHNRPMWPINGRYICSDCLRSFPVAWETSVPKRPSHPMPSASHPAFDSGVLAADLRALRWQNCK